MIMITIMELINRFAINCDYRTIVNKFRVSYSSAIRCTNKVNNRIIYIFMDLKI